MDRGEAKLIRKLYDPFSTARQWASLDADVTDDDQIDLVEVMDVSGGLITHHRVYWGWVGFRTLSKLAAGAK